MKTTYKITVTTGLKFGAGTDANITVEILGELGDSGPHVLNKRLRDDFEAGSVDDFEVEGEDVGEVVALRVRNTTAMLKDDWLLEEIDVTCRDVTRRFPCQRWVKADTEMLIVEGSARLPQHQTSPRMASLREAHVAARRELYRWGEQGIPGLGQIDVTPERPLPLDEQYRDLADRSYHVTYAATLSRLQLARPLLSVAWNVLENVMDLLRYVGVPSVSERWRDDREFARQALQGTCPNLIQLAHSLPEGMPLDDDDVQGLLDRGVFLDGAFAEKRMFLLQFPILAGLPMFHTETGGGPVIERWAPPARALFYRGDDEQLRPVAIQLDPTPGAPVFTPNDSENDWLAAKLFVRCAEGNVHQVLAHAVSTHFVIEPFIISMMRNVSAQHPVYKLTRRHFRYTLAINQGARKTLLSVGGVFDDFMSTGGPAQGHMKLALRAWETWRFSDLRLPDDLRRRGVDDKAVLRFYPYRDDAMPLWRAIGSYVSDTLSHFYRGDHDVANDTEMQAFWRDLTAHGLPVEKLPFARLERFEDLCDMLQTLIFTVSVAHAAVNNLQFEHYGWVPNAPLGMHRPPPKQKGQITPDELQRMLPSLDQAMGQIAIGKALSTLGKDEEFLLGDGGWKRPYFLEPEVLTAQRAFFALLQLQVAGVNVANNSRAVPYEVLRADRVPCSVTI